jgi:hypothetical protein
VKKENDDSFKEEIGLDILYELPISYKYMETANYTVNNAKLVKCSFYKDEGYYSILFYKPITKYKLKNE